MIRYVQNDQIDFSAWDACIEKSKEPLIYASSTYLNLVASDWDALIENDYERVMPLPFRLKMGVKYLYQPAFCQQLGIFGQECDETKVLEFLTMIPAGFKFAEIMLNALNPIHIPFIEPQTNITLDINRSKESIRAHYNNNTRRNIKKAITEGLTVHIGFDIEPMITLFQSNKGKEVNQTKEWYNVLRHVAFQLRHKESAHTYSVTDRQNSIIAAALTVTYCGRVILLFSGSNAIAHESGAMHYLIDSILADTCNRHQIFDFEGSNHQNLARFYLGFGGIVSKYHLIRINRLPFPFRWLKKPGITI